MLTNNNVHFSNELTEEYGAKLNREMDGLRRYMIFIKGTILSLYWILFATVLFLVSMVFIKSRDGSFFDEKSNYLICLIIVFAMIAYIFKTLKMRIDGYIYRKIQNYSMDNELIIKKMMNFMTLRGIYNDMQSGRLSIVGFEETGIKARCVVNGKMQVINIPVKYNISYSDVCQIVLFDDHLDIAINEEMRKGLGI